MMVHLGMTTLDSATRFVKISQVGELLKRFDSFLRVFVSSIRQYFEPTLIHFVIGYFAGNFHCCQEK